MNTSKSEKEATKILKEFNVTEAPVDVNAIANSLLLKVSYEPLDSDISGVMLHEEGKTSVAINSSHHTNRQRFTLAHEIGHLILHIDSNSEKIHIDKRFFRNEASSKGEQKQEIEANAFAACLLMPANFIARSIEKRILTDMDIHKLALRYKVSEQSMTLRLVKLDYIQPD